MSEDPATGWIGHPFHLRRVYSAASRAAASDERGQLDDWTTHWLKRTRREAKRDHTQDEIDEWTMMGLQDGRIDS